MKLIDKDALVAEIERRIKEYQSTGDDYWFPVIENLKSILSFIATFEIKEMDLEKEVDLLIKYSTWAMANREDFLRVAKHFFELGIKARIDK